MDKKVLERRKELIQLIEDVLRNHYDYPAQTILMKLEDAGVEIMKHDEVEDDNVSS